MNDADKTITITVEEYQKLLDRDLMLACLENCGVDNWEGAEDAADAFHEMKEEH